MAVCLAAILTVDPQHVQPGPRVEHHVRPEVRAVRPASVGWRGRQLAMTARMAAVAEQRRRRWWSLVEVLQKSVVVVVVPG